MKRIIAFLISMSCLVSLLPTVSAASNTGTTNGWRAGLNNVTAEYAHWGLDDTTFYSGQNSLKLSYDLPVFANRYFMFYQTVNVKKNTTYRYGCAVKAKNARSCGFWLSHSNRRDLLPLGGTADWNTYEYSWTSTNQPDITIMLAIENVTEALWIDDVWFKEVLEDGTLGPNLLKSGGFDTGLENVSTGSNKEIGSLENTYNKILTSQSFSADDMRKVVGGFSYAPVYKAENIEIDGDLSDWEGYPEIALPTKSTQYHIYDPTHPTDAKAWCRYAYDDENFYLGIKVQDDIIKTNNESSTFWLGDSIQIALCDVGMTFEEEIGWSFNPEGRPTMGSNVFSEAQLNQINIQAVKTKDGLIYECAVPWSLKYEDGKLPDGFLFDIIVNDNDSDPKKNREYVLELAPGMAATKISTEYPYLEFRGEAEEWYGWIEGPSELRVDEKGYFEYYLVNDGEEKSVTVTSPGLGITEEITIPANTGIHRTFEMTWNERGNYDFVITASDGTNTHEAKTTLRVKPNATNYSSMITEVQNWTVEIKKLLDKCEEKGISADYEKVNWAVLNRFANEYPYEFSPASVGQIRDGYLKADIDAGNFERVEWNYDLLETIYKEAKEKLEAYLAGTAEPLPVSRYVTSPIELDGQMVYTTTETNGKKEKRPFFFQGYGHFTAVGADAHDLQDFGSNIIQMSLEPWNCIEYGGSNETPFRINREHADIAKMHWVFQKAEENNVKVDFLLGVHGAAPWIKDKWTDFNGANLADVVVQQPQILIHPIYKKLCDIIVDFTMEEFGHYESLNSICLTNEPTTNTHSQYYLGYWAQYLTELYGADINNLNEVYGTEYKSFMDVPMQSIPNFTVQFYDWKTFNDAVLTEANRYLAERVKMHNPDIPVHAKMMTMGRAHDVGIEALRYGTQHELFADFSDINGNDASAYIHSQHFAISEMEFFQDIQTSIKEAPCFNSEDHIMIDGNKELTLLQQHHVYAKLWQSYVHANAFSAVWTWGLETDPTVHTYGLPSSDPSVLVKIGHVNFDANRLAYELQSIIEKEADIAIVYPYKSRAFTQYTQNAAYRVWWAGMQQGIKTKLLIEDQIEDIHKYDAVIIPNITNVSEKTVAEIKKYAESGKKILYLGDESLGKNYSNKPHNAEDITFIRDRSQFIDTEGSGAYISSHDNSDYIEIMRNLVKELDLDEIEVIDLDTGKPVEDVEYLYAEHDGKTIINFHTMDESKVRKLKIYKNGVEQKNLFELISNKQLPSSTVELEVYRPQLIRLDDNSEAPAEAEEETIKIVIDGKNYEFTDAKPYIDERSRTLVPARFVSEALNAEVGWEPETKTVRINKAEDEISYVIGSYEAVKNGETVTFDSYGVIKDNRTFVPVRFISTLLNCEVEWDGETKTVIIKSAEFPEENVAEETVEATEEQTEE